MVKEIDKSLKWYTEILGFEVDSCYPETNPVYYDFKSDGGACVAIGLVENMTPSGRYNFCCGDTDELWERLKDKVTVIEPIWTPLGKQESLPQLIRTVMSLGFKVNSITNNIQLIYKTLRKGSYYDKICCFY